MHRRGTVDWWTAGDAASRLTAPVRFLMDKPWTTRRVAHRLPIGRRLPTSATALHPIVIKAGKVKTNTGTTLGLFLPGDRPNDRVHRTGLSAFVSTIRENLYSTLSIAL